MNAAFFDVDGTLVDSMADIAATVNHTRRQFGLCEIPVSEVAKHVGLGARHLLVHSIPEMAEEGDRLWDAFRSHYAEHSLDNVAPYPGVIETLETLKSKGWLLGINTAKPNFAVKAILEHLGMTDFFGDAVIAGGDCPEMKPSPLPLKMCAEKAGHKLTPCDWMVGDNWTDVECAKNAGVKGAFCAFGFGVLKETSTYDARLDCMTDLLKFTVDGAK
ncbi:MAG: HAD hydrolase-like protein [Kiritimatiellae bacterium]|nr:HAD hydrolase-like protein [Kiritimatiellia bacterium]